jgi:hypothetical protein
VTAAIKFSEARRDMSRVVDRVEAGGIAVIERRGFKVLLTSFDEASDLLAGAFDFHPVVYPGDDGSVAIWLPELAEYGTGDTLAEAEEDLIDAVLEYVADWYELFHDAPNHAGNRGWVLRLALADDRHAVRRIVFGT